MSDWREVKSKHEAKEWRLKDGGLTLVIWQSGYDVPRGLWQPLVLLGRADSLKGAPDLPTFKAAERECRRLAALIRKAAAVTP